MSGPIPEPTTPHEARALMLRSFEDCALPLYGIGPTWQGFRHLAGADVQETVSHSPREMLRTSLSYALGHRSTMLEETPFLDVTTTDDVRDGPRAQLVLPLVDPERDMPRSREDLHRGAHLRTREVDVDGRALTFDVLEDDHRFAAACRVDDVTLLCQGSGIDLAEVGLVRITDLEPYLRGYVELFDAHVR